MKKPGENNTYVRGMTVAQIREDAGADFIEVVFLESARFYKLLKKNPAFEKMLGLLQDSLKRNRVLKIHLTSIDSDIIMEVLE